MRHISCCAVLVGLCLSSSSFANPTFLPAEQAFAFSVESLSPQRAQLHWQIAPHYYLYHQQFQLKAAGQNIALNLPQGQMKDDPTFGRTEVHYQQVNAEFTVNPNTQYTLIYQGCAQDGLCYPPQKQQIETDADGLFPQLNRRSQPHLGNAELDQSFLNRNKQQDTEVAASAQHSTPLSTPTAKLTATAQQSQIQDTETHSPTTLIEQSSISSITADAVDDHSAQNPAQTSVQNRLPTTAVNPNASTTQTDKSPTTSLQWNDDLRFFKLLSTDQIAFNLLIFFGLGILLAFLPCSLPLIPILSTLILQRRTGYQAVMIVGSFIVSMATVYGLMGVFVAEIGYSFQRWFQNPIMLVGFAGLFLLFALNLFGVFELSLPQAWVNRLNQFQDRQKAGTLFGSISMGALSALIVGPCMSAPLAGALLFVAQTHQALLGGLYLFILGLGIGLPLFIASVFGSRLLPKPGQWMNHLKVCFGFMMLMMALYFIRPMFNGIFYSSLWAVLCAVLCLYLIKLFSQKNHVLNKMLLLVAVLGSATATFWHIKQVTMQVNAPQQSATQALNWHRVSDQSTLQQALINAQQQGKRVVLDVYADWCVACQPLEKEVFNRADVQLALAPYYLIQLNLSDYNASQDLILKQHEILGPPTLLLFDQAQQEQREQRLTGRFNAEQLIERLK